MKKRLLILGAGRGQVGLYKAAKELGIETIAATMPSDNLPCIPLADEVSYVDISNPEEVLKKAFDLKIDGVATCCLDTGIVSLGKVVDALELTGLSEQAAVMCGDKFKMKEAFMKKGVSTAKFCKVSSEEELRNSLEKLKKPLIIKATDLQGSRGIYIAHTEDEIFLGFREAMSLTKKEYCIVEEFIEGLEFGAQAFVYDGKILFVLPHGDETFMSHTAIPVAHYVPFEFEEQFHTIEQEVIKAIEALGLNNCAVNVDMILKEGQIYIIEITGRVGANCLPELVEINYGIEYYKMIALLALGESPMEFWNKRRTKMKAGFSQMFFSKEKSGIIDELDYLGEFSDSVKEVTFFKKVGETINQFQSSNDCLGQIIVQGNTLDECRNTIKKQLELIHLKIS